jgi:hypothetical protein
LVPSAPSLSFTSKYISQPWTFLLAPSLSKQYSFSDFPALQLLQDAESDLQHTFSYNLLLKTYASQEDLIMLGLHYGSTDFPRHFICFKS